MSHNDNVLHKPLILLCFIVKSYLTYLQLGDTGRRISSLRSFHIFLILKIRLLGGGGASLAVATCSDTTDPKSSKKLLSRYYYVSNERGWLFGDIVGGLAVRNGGARSLVRRGERCGVGLVCRERFTLCDECPTNKSPPHNSRQPFRELLFIS